MRFNFLGLFALIPITLFATSNKIKDLSNSKYWHILGHYKNGVSEIDSPNFFLSKNGKYSPYEELNATIYYLVNPKFKDDNSTYCKFPARREWIKKVLPNLKIKKQNCKELKQELDTIKNIKSVTLVFPTILMNSPASMFGHTLLRLDDKNGDLLNSFAINYAAHTNETNGLIYAIKGLTGGYLGKYAIVPYYKKIAEYNDMKNRDIWEYQLNLTPKEIDRLKLHLYEVKNTWSYYYYFNKNCSYQILWLLEAARPSLKIVYKFNYKTLPVDTIKEAKKENLIKSVYFRPSKKRQILYYFNKIKNKDLAIKFEKTRDINLLNNLPVIQKIYILDFAVEMLNYKYISKEIDRKTYLKNYIKLLKLRSKLPKEKELKIAPPTKDPTFSHDSNKIWFYLTLKKAFFGFKPSFHYIDDINTAFIPGAYIDFFVFGFKTNPLMLDYLYFFRVNSLTPRNKLFKPISWGVNLGLERFLNNKLYAMLLTKAALTYKYKTILYSFEAYLEDYYKTKNYFAPAIGFYFENNFKNLKTTLQFRREFFRFSPINRVEANLIYKIKRNFSINAGYKKDINNHHFFAGFSLYFL